MILILGGAYQGKLDFAKAKFHLNDADVFSCTDQSIDLSKPCIYGLETFVYHCLLQEIDPVEYIKANRSRLDSTVFICQDIFCGVVPMERQLRLWRDATGKLCQYLSREASEVYRIYCGLEQRLK